MSAEAMGDAWRRSPLVHDQLLVHLAIADVVNDVHGNELWMLRPNLAEKARVSRGTVDTALRVMVDQGWLVVLEKGGGRGKATRYRYVLGGGLDLALGDTAHPVGGSPGETAQPGANTAQIGAASPLVNPRDQSPAAPPTPVQSPAVVEAQGGPRPGRARNEVWDALVAVFGEPGPRAERSFYGRVVRELKTAGITDGAEVEARARRARALWADCSPNVLTTRWSALAAGNRPTRPEAPPSRSPWSESA